VFRRVILLIVSALMVATMLSAMGAAPAMAHVCPDGSEVNLPPDSRTNWDAICHRTGSATNPFVAIVPSCNAVREDGPAHLPHNTPAGPGVDEDLAEEECTRDLFP
jgi:hypothetical protein